MTRISRLRFETNAIGDAFFNDSYIEFAPQCIAWIRGRDFDRVNWVDNLPITIEKNQAGTIQVKIRTRIFRDNDDQSIHEGPHLMSTDTLDRIDVIANWTFVTNDLGTITTLDQIGLPTISGVPPRMEISLLFQQSETDNTVSLAVTIREQSGGTSFSASARGLRVGTSNNYGDATIYQDTFTFRISVTNDRWQFITPQIE